MDMEYMILGRTGLRVSRLGLGGAPIGGDFGEVSEQDAISTVHAALDEGINYIDTAPLYGRGESERRIGKALMGRRSQVVLVSKAVMRGETYTYENTIRSVEDSLQRLNTDWVDLIQLHEADVVTYEEAMEGTIAAFLKLKEQGKVRAIGVNSGQLELLAPFMRSGCVDTVQVYNRYTLLDQSAKQLVFPLAREYGVAVIHGSPLHMGILADNPAPFLQKYPEALGEAERKMKQLSFLRMPGPHGLVEAAMRFSLSCPDIAVTLTGASSPEVVRENAAYCDGRGLAEEDMERLSSYFDEQKRV